MKMNAFEKQIAGMGVPGLHARQFEVLQVNVGLRCNQHCVHCHLNCSPSRSETMHWSVMESIRDAARRVRPRLVDLTGGAPELNPNVRRFIDVLSRDGHRVQVRTNLTVLLEPGMEGLPEFLRDHEVQLVASMPCYLEENVEAQRGEGAYRRSIEAMKRLNALGYGADPGLALNLVYNPAGAFLPPDQSALEADYRRELAARFGVTFTNLFTITNMPIGKFLTKLRRENSEQKYMQLLRDAFNVETVEGLMCRHQISVGWDGILYDCDFNLALGWAVDHGAPSHITKFDVSVLAGRRIVTGDHCFGCTAGPGSSCGGALA